MISSTRRLFARLFSLFRSGSAEHELAREIEAHLRLLEDSFVARGMSPADARAAARRAFGGVEQAKERHRDARAFRALAGWPMDLRLGARMLVKSPGLTLVAGIALAVAIGGGAAYLEVVNDLFRPTLPVPHADRIIGIQNWDSQKNQPELRSLGSFVAWRQSVRSIELLGVQAAFERNLITADGRSEPTKGVEVSATAFQLVPAAPLLGRPLLASDESPAAPPVVLIGERLWKNRFASDPDVVGRTVHLGRVPHTVVGVMPEAFGFPVNHSMWVPFRVDSEVPAGAGPAVHIFGRLAAGVDANAAQEELAAIAAREPSGDADRPALRPVVRPYVDALLSSDADAGASRTILDALNLFFLGLLAICGANVATLVFARTATREGEITVRTALGASRGRIVSQLFTEALVLTGLAAAAGLGAAAIGVRVLRTWVETQGVQPPFWWRDELAPMTLLYGVALAVVAAAVIGIVPALKATGPEMQARLKHAAAGGSGMTFGGIWTTVIIGQVALTVLFLMTVVSLGWNAAAGASGRTAFLFAPHEYLSARLELDENVSFGNSGAATSGSRFLAAYRDIERRLESQPHIAAVSYATDLPGTTGDEFWVELDGLEPATQPTDGPLWVKSHGVAADMFETFGAPILQGRGFTAGDVEAERAVAVVDETFARLIFGGRPPVGQRVRHQASAEHPQPGPWLEIIGVVKDLGAKDAKTTEDAVLYRPALPGRSSPIRIAVHVKGDAPASPQSLQSAAAAAGPDVRLYDVQTLDQLYRADTIAHGFMAQGMAVVSAVALLLATAGVYALMSFTLARRTREIGIRAALGASPRRIVTAIFSRAFTQVGGGVIAGSIPGTALVAFGAPEVARGGGLTIAILSVAVVALAIVAIAMFACVVPARRALRVHPTDALRADG